jgi:methyl-accepting chemotaxis protein
MGIGQINQGIMQVSNVIQSNSATAEESAASNFELLKQIKKLKLQLGYIRVKPMTQEEYKESLKHLTPEIIAKAKKALAEIEGETKKVKLHTLG